MDTIDPQDVISLARTLVAAAATPGDWKDACEEFRPPRPGSRRMDWSSAGITVSGETLRVAGLQAYSRAGRLNVDTGSSMVHGLDAGMKLAQEIAAAVGRIPGGRDALGMLVARIVVDLGRPVGRRIPAPTYRERLHQLRASIGPRRPSARQS